jgi:hypothetical protein
MSTKKNVLFVGIFGVLFIGFLFILDSHVCYINETCKTVRRAFNQDIFTIIFITPPLFLLSLITYRLKEEVFRAWWNFARWFVPVVIVASFFLNGAGGGGLGISGAVSGAFNFLVLCIFYAVFILVSLIRIVLAYRRTR